MTRDTDPRAIPDAATAACLGDGRHLAWCISTSGDIWPWIVAPHDDGTVGCNCPDCAPHEQHRPIPHRMQVMLDRPVQPRCGRPRADGQPCRTFVARPGTACHWHRTTTRGVTR